MTRRRSRPASSSAPTRARDHEYWVYVPDDYDANYSYGLLLWLHPVGKGKEKDFDAMKEVWEDLCIDHKMILVCASGRWPERLGRQRVGLRSAGGERM